MVSTPEALLLVGCCPHGCELPPLLLFCPTGSPPAALPSSVAALYAHSRNCGTRRRFSALEDQGKALLCIGSGILSLPMIGSGEICHLLLSSMCSSSTSPRMATKTSRRPLPHSCLPRELTLSPCRTRWTSAVNNQVFPHYQSQCSVSVQRVRVNVPMRGSGGFSKLFNKLAATKTGCFKFCFGAFGDLIVQENDLPCNIIFLANEEIQSI